MPKSLLKFSTVIISEPGQPDVFLEKVAGPNRSYTRDHRKAAKANNRTQQKAWGLSVALDKAGRGALGKGKGKAKGLEKGKAFSFFATVREVDIEEIEVKQRDIYVLPTGTRKDLRQLTAQDRRKKIKILPAPNPEILLQIQDSQD